MDEMQQYELNSIIQNIPYLDRNEKEINRYKLFVSVQSNSKKKINIEELLPLVWDKENKNTGTKISEEEAQRLRDRAKQLENRIQNMKFETVEMNEMYKNIQLNNG